MSGLWDMRRVVSTLFVRRLQVLAVAAPRRSERDNCIMIFVLLRIQVRNGTIRSGAKPLTRTTSSNVWASRTTTAGGGGGLMFDLIPDFFVILENAVISV